MTSPDPVAAAERAYASGTITRQRLSQIRQQHGVAPGPVGRPPTPAKKLKRTAGGNILQRVLCSADVMAAVSIVVAGPPRVTRRAALSAAVEHGFAAMAKRPPRAHELPGERPPGREPIAEIWPDTLARIDAYAAEHGTTRTTVIAMAAARGVAMMRRNAR